MNLSLSSLAERFASVLHDSLEWQTRLETLQARSQRAQELLSPSHLSSLSEAEIRALFFDSDAFTAWKNPESNFRARLKTRGLEGLRHALGQLISCAEKDLTPADLSRVLALRGLGKGLCSELLAYRFPARYWIWNRETLPALQFLSFKFETQKTDAETYFALREPLHRVLETLHNAGLDADYLHVALFLAWTTQNANDQTETAPLSWQDALQPVFASRGLHFSHETLAAFVTALETKGFVILSGISGVGKTRLAQEFAALLPQPSSRPSAGSAITITIQPAMLKTGRVPLSGAFQIDWPQTDKDALVTFANRNHLCRLLRDDAGQIELVLRGAARSWFTKNFMVGDVLSLEPEVDNDRDLMNLRAFRQDAISSTRNTEKRERNFLFLSVRPDWRDSKALLGYYNPLSERYETTPFLRFVIEAQNSFRADDGVAYFVLLDEMNLARVEYYFADFLSVLEAGRDEQGWTREALQLQASPDNKGAFSPAELHLPPNLFFIGTVNEDETTHAFSPKVLDRAWTIELNEVDFCGYLQNEPALEWSETQRVALGQSLARGHRFTHWHKNDVAQTLAQFPQIRPQLQNLNNLLQPHELGFGYRVFDEITIFVRAAQNNGLFANTFNDNRVLETEVEPQETDAKMFEKSFDIAVSAKVLPKFAGRARLQKPLRALLSWCLQPDAPDEKPIDDALRSSQTSSGETKVLTTQLAALSFVYSVTALRAIELLNDILSSGFGS